jgi:hypothetical protein
MDIKSKYNKDTYIGYLKIKKGGMKIVSGEIDNSIISKRDDIINHLKNVLSGGKKLKEKYLKKYFKALGGKYVRSDLIGLSDDKNSSLKDVHKLLKLSSKKNIPLVKVLDTFKGSAPSLYKALEYKIGGVSDNDNDTDSQPDLEPSELKENKYKLIKLNNGDGVLLKYIQDENAKSAVQNDWENVGENAIQKIFIVELVNKKGWDIKNPSTWIYKDLIAWIKDINQRFKVEIDGYKIDPKYGHRLGSIMNYLIGLNTPVSYNLRSFLMFQYFNHENGIPENFTYIPIVNRNNKLNLEIIIAWWTLEISFSYIQGEQFIRCKSHNGCNDVCDADLRALIQVAKIFKGTLNKTDATTKKKIEGYFNGVYYANLWNKNLDIPTEYMNDIWTKKIKCESTGGHRRYSTTYKSYHPEQRIIGKRNGGYYNNSNYMNNDDNINNRINDMQNYENPNYINNDDNIIEPYSDNINNRINDMQNYENPNHINNDDNIIEPYSNNMQNNNNSYYMNNDRKIMRPYLNDITKNNRNKIMRPYSNNMIKVKNIDKSSDINNINNNYDDNMYGGSNFELNKLRVEIGRSNFDLELNNLRLEILNLRR